MPVLHLLAGMTLNHLFNAFPSPESGQSAVVLRKGKHFSKGYQKPSYFNDQ